MKKFLIAFYSVLGIFAPVIAMSTEQRDQVCQSWIKKEDVKPIQGKIYHFNAKATAYNNPGVSELSFIKVMFGQNISQTQMDEFIQFISNELVAYDVKVRNLIGLNRLVFQGKFGITKNEFQEALDKANKEVFNVSEVKHPQHVIHEDEAQTDTGSVRVEKQQCGVCLEDQADTNFVVLSCEHIYCNGCLEYLVNQAIREKTSAQLKCPNPHCTQPIAQEDIKKITNNDQTKVDAVAEILTREFLLTQLGAKQCPTANCTYAFINDDHMQTVTCPQCDQKYCSQCLFDHERTMTCQEADDLRPSDKDTAEWLQHNTKACPNCNARVERNGGCLYITCKICKKGFCWNCNMDHHASACNRPAAQQVPIVLPRDNPMPAANPAIMAREANEGQYQNLPLVYIDEFKQYHRADSQHKLMASRYSNRYNKPLYCFKIRFNRPITRPRSDELSRFLTRYGDLIIHSRRNLSNLDRHMFEIDTFTNRETMQQLLDRYNQERDII